MFQLGKQSFILFAAELNKKELNKQKKENPEQIKSMPHNNKSSSSNNLLHKLNKENPNKNMDSTKKPTKLVTEKLKEKDTKNTKDEQKKKESKQKKSMQDNKLNDSNDLLHEFNDAIIGKIIPSARKPTKLVTNKEKDTKNEQKKKESKQKKSMPDNNKLNDNNLLHKFNDAYVDKIIESAKKRPFNDALNDAKINEIINSAEKDTKDEQKNSMPYNSKLNDSNTSLHRSNDANMNEIIESAKKSNNPFNLSGITLDINLAKIEEEPYSFNSKLHDNANNNIVSDPSSPRSTTSLSSIKSIFFNPYHTQTKNVDVSPGNSNNSFMYTTDNSTGTRGTAKFTPITEQNKNNQIQHSYEDSSIKLKELFLVKQANNSNMNQNYLPQTPPTNNQDMYYSPIKSTGNEYNNSSQHSLALSHQQIRQFINQPSFRSQQTYTYSEIPHYSPSPTNNQNMYYYPIKSTGNEYNSSSQHSLPLPHQQIRQFNQPFFRSQQPYTYSEIPHNSPPPLQTYYNNTSIPPLATTQQTVRQKDNSNTPLTFTKKSSQKPERNHQPSKQKNMQPPIVIKSKQPVTTIAPSNITNPPNNAFKIPITTKKQIPPSVTDTISKVRLKKTWWNTIANKCGEWWNAVVTKFSSWWHAITNKKVKHSGNNLTIKQDQVNNKEQPLQGKSQPKDVNSYKQLWKNDKENLKFPNGQDKSNEKMASIPFK